MMQNDEGFFDKTQRSFIADKLMDSANAVLVAFVLSQLVSPQPQQPNVAVMALGAVVYTWGWIVAIIFKREVRKRDDDSK